MTCYFSWDVLLLNYSQALSTNWQDSYPVQTDEPVYLPGSLPAEIKFTQQVDGKPYLLRKYKEWENIMSTMKLTLLTDLYELTMMQGYFKNHSNETVVFDAF